MLTETGGLQPQDSPAALQAEGKVVSPTKNLDAWEQPARLIDSSVKLSFKDYRRLMGELHVATKDMPARPESNVLFSEQDEKEVAPCG